MLLRPGSFGAFCTISYFMRSKFANLFISKKIVNSHLLKSTINFLHSIRARCTHVFDALLLFVHVPIRKQTTMRNAFILHSFFVGTFSFHFTLVNLESLIPSLRPFIVYAIYIVLRQRTKKETENERKKNATNNLNDQTNERKKSNN